MLDFLYLDISSDLFQLKIMMKGIDAIFDPDTTLIPLNYFKYVQFGQFFLNQLNDPLLFVSFWILGMKYIDNLFSQPNDKQKQSVDIFKIEEDSRKRNTLTFFNGEHNTNPAEEKLQANDIPIKKLTRKEKRKLAFAKQQSQKQIANDSKTPSTAPASYIVNISPPPVTGLSSYNFYNNRSRFTHPQSTVFTENLSNAPLLKSEI